MKFTKRLSDRGIKVLSACLVSAGILLLATSLVFALNRDASHTVTTYSMGSYVQQTVYGKNGEEAAQEAASRVAQLEDLISWRVENSDVALLNQQAGKEFISLDSRTVEILETAVSVCSESGGAFDITIAPVSRLWHFDDDPTLPDEEMIKRFAAKVDYNTLSVLDDGTAALRSSGTALDLGAVGKGAACDEAVRVYESMGISRGVVAVGGSVGVYGSKPFGSSWKIAIRNPEGEGSVGTLEIPEGFVSTSGSYEKTFTQDGITYHHILDPATGYPAESGLVSVTVWSDGGALSDSLSTACFVLGYEKSLPLLSHFGAEAIFITEDNQVYVTQGIEDSFTLDSDTLVLA